jgi:two-component system phosphate regulon sensor histidine kinase PhoR
VEPAVGIAILFAIVAAIALAVAIGRGRDLHRAMASVDRLRTEGAEQARLEADRDTADTAFRETLVSGVLRVDQGLRIRDANSPAHELLGRAAGGLTGRSLMEAFMDPGVEALARTAIDVGSASGEIRSGGPDGPALIVRARGIPGDGAWLVLDDVSELRRLQRIRAEFIDNLSHELRTPLTTVSLLAETLQREAESVGDAIPAKMRERIAKIEVETGHLVQMSTSCWT